LSGKTAAYEEIVRRYETRVRHYCLSVLANQSSADDAAQEIFIKAYQSLSKFKGNSSFATWIYRITANHCTDILRKTSRQKTESWEKILESEGEKIEALFSDSSRVSNLEHAELLDKLLSRLDDKSKEILILREMHSLSYQELAETLTCSVDAVKSRLKRARQEMKAICDTFSAFKTSK